MKPSPSSLVLAVLALLWLMPGACSNSSSSTAAAPAPTPVQGWNFVKFLPMGHGDRYELGVGLTLYIELATEPNILAGPITDNGPIMRLVFDDGFHRRGMYWSHGSKYGSLIHGTFDELEGNQMILDMPVPVLPMEDVPGGGFNEFSPIGSNWIASTGTTSYRSLNLFDPFLIPPPIFGSPFGNWRSTREILNIRWSLSFKGPVVGRKFEVEMALGPGFGPLSVKIDGVCYRTWKAVVGGRLFDPGARRRVEDIEK